MKLTQGNVDRLRLPAGKAEHFEWDDDLKGFAVRLRAGGKRSWICQFRIGSVQRRTTLGTVEVLSADKARRAAKDTLAKVQLGGDPQAAKVEERAKAKVTFGALIESYLAFKAAKLGRHSMRENTRYLGIDWKPLHALPVHRITRRDIAARLSEMVADGRAIPADRARAIVSGFFAWCVGEGLRDDNPVTGTHRPVEEPVKRDRVLNDAELAEIWAACGDDDHGRIVKLLALTGCRRSEIADLVWAEIDFDGAVISLPPERTKNHKPHTIPLAPIALDILASVKPRPGREWLFGQGERGYQGWTEAKDLLDQRIAEARQRAGNQEPIPGWRHHDLRRTFATRLADLGTLPHAIEAALNHISGHKAGVAGVYNHSVYANEVRTAFMMWAEHVRALVDGSPATVVPLLRPA